MKKVETSKIFLLFVSMLAAILTIVASYQMIKLDTIEPLTYLIPSIFAELGCATAFYYWKARTENKAKILTSAINEIYEKNELTDCQIQILQSLIENLN